MEYQVSKSTFKAQALEFFRQVEATGTPLLVTSHGKPTIEIRRYQAQQQPGPASLEGSVLHYDEPCAAVGEADWEALS